MTAQERAREIISNAFYGARNAGRTMEDACDAAVRNLDRAGLLKEEV